MINTGKSAVFLHAEACTAIQVQTRTTTYRRRRYTSSTTSGTSALSNQREGSIVTKLVANGMAATAVANDTEIESALQEARTCSNGKDGQEVLSSMVADKEKESSGEVLVLTLIQQERKIIERSCPLDDIEFVLGQHHTTQDCNANPFEERVDHYLLSL